MTIVQPLSRREVAAFTRTPRKAAQLAFLRRNGIRHYVDNDGWPVVTASAIEGMADQAQAGEPWKPNKVA